MNNPAQEDRTHYENIYIFSLAFDQWMTELSKQYMTPLLTICIVKVMGSGSALRN